jgi:hypothetical protein
LPIGSTSNFAQDALKRQDYDEKEEEFMSASTNDKLNRREFIKTISAGISGLIATLVGIPSIAYLLSPAYQAREDDKELIPLGLLETYPIGVPTRFEYTRTKVNGWERTTTQYGLYVL